MSHSDLRSTIETILRKAPDWIRHDLASKDEGVRERAEDALAAMIDAAIAVNGSDAAA